MSIMEKAQELGEAIIKTTEYNDLKAKENVMITDEDAKSLLNEFEALNKRLQMAQANGKKITTKQEKELNSIKVKMQANNKIKSFMEAQQNFNKVIQTVNQTVFNFINGKKD